LNAGWAGLTVRIAPLVPLPAVLHELGYDPATVLGAAGFDLAHFSDPDLPVPYRAVGGLLAHCVRATGCTHLGLLLGMRGGPHTVGVAGHLMTHAPDVGLALVDLVRYLDLHDRGGTVSLDTEGEVCALRYAIIEPEIEASDQIHDLAMALACKMMRELCGSAWTPAAVELPRQRPADAEAWRRYFRAPVVFDSGGAALHFARRWLAAPVPGAEPTLHGFLQRHADSVHGEGAAGVVFEVRRVVRRCIAEGGGHAAQVAPLLGVHPRTLDRRLAVAGTTFRQVREEVLQTMAVQLLGTTTMPVAAVAAALGYADATAFIRAFRRWTGGTPAQWRRQRQGSVANGAAPASGPSGRAGRRP
jgi:AraC-like DNA-binding protein